MCVLLCSVMVAVVPWEETRRWWWWECGARTSLPSRWAAAGWTVVWTACPTKWETCRTWPSLCVEASPTTGRSPEVGDQVDEGDKKWFGFCNQMKWNDEFLIAYKLFVCVFLKPQSSFRSGPFPTSSSLTTPPLSMTRTWSSRLETSTCCKTDTKSRHYKYILQKTVRLLDVSCPHWQV